MDPIQIRQKIRQTLDDHFANSIRFALDFGYDAFITRQMWAWRMSLVQFRWAQFSASRTFKACHGDISGRFSFSQEGRGRNWQMAWILATATYRLWPIAISCCDCPGWSRYRRSPYRYHFWHASYFWRTSSAISHYACFGARRSSWFCHYVFSPYATCRCLAHYSHRRGKYWLYLPRRKRHVGHRHWRYVRRGSRKFCSGYRLFARIYQRLRFCHHGRNFWFYRAIYYYRYFWRHTASHAQSRRRHCRFWQSLTCHWCFLLDFSTGSS